MQKTDFKELAEVPEPVRQSVQRSVVPWMSYLASTSAQSTLSSIVAGEDDEETPGEL